MAFTRVQYRTRVQRRMDAVGSSRWDSSGGSSGEIDQVLGIVHWREWKRILNANRFYRFGSRTVTSHVTTGRYALSDLNSGSGDTLETYYRVLSFVIDDIVYEESQFTDWVLGETKDWAPRVWFQEGDNIMALPKTTSETATVYVNHVPQRIDLLSADSISVTFPDAYEEVICLEAAALLLAKGGTETGATAEFKSLAEEMRQDLLQDIARLSTKPQRFRSDDSPLDWAG